MAELTAAQADRLGADALRIADRIEALSAYRDDRQDGWAREVFSEPYRDARGWIRRQMIEAGLTTRVDAMGNVIGVLPGSRPGAPALVTGSHTDTVARGGRYDGIVGVLAAIELAAWFRDHGITLEHDLVVVDFLGEEANRFGLSCLGSRAIAGALTPAHLDLTDEAGERLGDALGAFGGDPAGALAAAWRPQDVHAYVELHVEQGALLEQSGHELGVVTAIAGIQRLLLTFAGEAGHAGTTAMADRHDALVAAAEAVLAVERVACGAPTHAVATPGHIEATPAGMAVISERAKLWAEMRSIDPDWLTATRSQLVADIAEQARRRGVAVEAEWLSVQAPVPATPAMQDLIAGSCDALGVPWKAVPSGAGHDAAHLARLAPMGMIFVPSAAGKSHCPEEFTQTAHIAQGAVALAHTLLRLDSTPNPT